MKFSKTKKMEMRKQRQKRLRNYFCSGYSVEIEESMKPYTIIAKMIKDGNYYLLLADEYSREVFIGKAVYSGYVKVVLLSSKKVLAHKDIFKKWLKDINHEASMHKYMVKYVLNEDGNIECRNTFYRDDYKLPRIIYNLRPIYREFQY